MPVTIAAQQNSNVVSGSSFIKRFPAPRLNTVFESAKAGYDDVSEFAEELAPSGSCLNASLLTVVAPHIPGSWSTGIATACLRLSNL